MKNLTPVLLLAAVSIHTAAYADNDTLDSLLIIGSKDDVQSLPGTGNVIDDEQINIEIATDIHQMLKTVPGVYIREEEGSGLRPNIGIRSATAERSSNITLLEDGVVIAPAPYSNPAAYYFPTTMRMSGIEILKGAPLLRHGPQTTGGVINLVSTRIPEENAGQITFITDERGSHDTHTYYGGRQGQWRYLLETVQRSGAGFKDIDRSNRDTGFDISDYVAKLGWESAGNGPRQSILFKAQYSEETSNETYLGLTDDDFRRDPNRRYGLSSIDQMENDHQGYSLTHLIELTPAAQLTTTLYHNEFKRNWFKLSGGGSLINDANNGNANSRDILHGLIDETGLQYKHNNREYLSQGIQFNVDMDFGNHQLAVGGRLHEDEMDRFQPIDIYDQVNGSLVYQSTTAPTGGDNREEGADAISFWLVDHWQATDSLNVMFALRYEDVETSRIQYADVNRTTIASRRSNTTDEWLPGLALTYDINEQWQILTGVHKGFSPLGGGAQTNEEPETSINWELGARFRDGSSFAEAVAFYSDFSNKLENCSVGSPCSDGSTSGTFVTGEAEIYGLELQAGVQWQYGAFTLPLDIAYTYTKAEIKKDNPTQGFSKGDALKDVPEHTFSLRAGVEHTSRWNNYLVAKYMDETCVQIGCDFNQPLERTQTLLVVDAISRYGLTRDAEVFLKVENLLDSQKIVARTPDGARPNKPQTVSAGITLNF